LPPPSVGLSFASAERASPGSKSWKIEAPPPSRSEKTPLPCDHLRIESLAIMNPSRGRSLSLAYGSWERWSRNPNVLCLRRCLSKGHTIRCLAGGEMPSRRTIKDLNDEMMIYEPEADLIHFLNRTARRIYQLHQLGMDSHTIEDVMRKEFEIPEGRDLQADIQRCLKEFRQKDLLGGEGEG